MAFTVIRTDDLGSNIVTVAKLALALDLQANDVKVAVPTNAKHAANKEYVDGRLGTASADLTAALNAEIVRATAAEGVLDGKITTETAARIAGDNALSASLSAEVSRASAAEAGLATDIAAEASARAAAVTAEAAARTSADNALGVRIDSLTTSVAADISAEQAARIAGDNALTASLNSEIARAQTAESALAAGLSAEQSARIAGDNALTASLASEIARAQSAEGVLTSGLAAEIARATAAEGAEHTRALAAEADLQAQFDAYEISNDAALAAETAARVAADGVLTTNLAAEVSRALAAEGVLTSGLSAEAARATAAEIALGVRVDNANTAIATEQAARIAGDNALAASLSAEVARATAAEVALGGRIDGVTVALNAEVSRAMAAEAVLQQNIEAGLQGLEVKDSVLGRFDFSAATGFTVSMLSGITKSGGAPMTDMYGSAVVDGGRYLVTAPVSAQGIWVANAAGAWTKAVDANQPGELDAGCFTYVENESAGWVLKADNSWSQFSGAGTYSVGNGLSLVGTRFSVKSSTEFAFDGTGIMNLAVGGVMGPKIGMSQISFGHMDADMQRRMGKFDVEVFATSAGQIDFTVTDCPVEDLVAGEILVFVNGIKRRCKNFGGVGDFTVIRDGGVPKVRFDYTIPADYEFCALYGKKNA